LVYKTRDKYINSHIFLKLRYHKGITIEPFKKDFNTIAGAMFDHKSETPGLGAEINTSAFRQQFKEKQIFDALGKYMPVRTVKGGAKKNDLHGVDAITGGTLTSNGLSNMLQDGLSVYVEYFNKQKK